MPAEKDTVSKTSYYLDLSLTHFRITRDIQGSVTLYL